MIIVNIIPSRLAATRFPNKPLVKIDGVPMVGHCYRRACLTRGVLGTYVATCDSAVAKYIESFGGKAIMTSNTHRRAATRTAEGANIIEDQIRKKIDVVIMVQGDEPLVSPLAVEKMITEFDDPEVDVVNLAVKSSDSNFVNDKNNVKVVTDLKSNAMYFSRECIPPIINVDSDTTRLIQTGIIGFRRDALLKFDNTEETPLELLESIDMNRLIENGDSVRILVSDEFCFGVDTPKDMKLAESLMSSDKYRALY
jgi:3-deoxy-manno-octulosonate cytidylyltransferase (CMP-KDO synthetase)